MSTGGWGGHLSSGVASSHCLWEGGVGRGEDWPGWGWMMWCEVMFRVINPHVFDWLMVCEGMCQLRLILINLTG